MGWELTILICVTICCITYLIITKMALRAMVKLDNIHGTGRLVPRTRIGRGLTAYPVKTAEGRIRRNEE